MLFVYYYNNRSFVVVPRVQGHAGSEVDFKFLYKKILKTTAEGSEKIEEKEKARYL